MSSSFNTFAWTPASSTARRVDIPSTHPSYQPAFQMPQGIGTNQHIANQHVPPSWHPQAPPTTYYSNQPITHPQAPPTTHPTNQPTFPMPQGISTNMRNPNHGQAPSDFRRRSLSPLLASPRMNHAPSNRTLLPSFASLKARREEPSLDPRLPKKTLPGDSLEDRVREFERDMERLNFSKVSAEPPVGHRPRLLGSSTAESQHAVHAEARTTTHMAGDNLTDKVVHPPAVTSTKRPRSPEDELDSEPESADGVNQYSQHRAAKVQETGRRRLSRNSVQPNRTIQSRASDSEDGDSLFVPARQLKIDSAAGSDTEINMTTTKTPSARELKQRLAGKHAKDFSRKVNPEKDPENIAIKRMRCVERMQFDDIADVLNKQRVSKGLEPTFTSNAVYGRFQRIAPRIAALEGQPDFNYRDYLHIPREARLTPTRNVALPTMSPQQERLFVEAYEMVKREVWVYTAAKFKDMGGFHLSPEQAALKFKSI